MYGILLLVCILLRGFSTFVSWIFIDYFTYFLGFVGSGLILYRVVRKQLAPNHIWIVVGLLCTVLLPQGYLDQGKFALLEQRYQTVAEQIVLATDDAADSYVGKYPLSFQDRLLLNNLEADVNYIKQGEQYVISFTKSRSFFNWYALVYFSSPDAVDFILHPSAYQEDLSDADCFDEVVWIESNKWARIKWY